MHELSVCWSLLSELERIALERGENTIAHVVVRVGPLSGTDPGLLLRAFEVARIGTKAENAGLAIEHCDVRVECTDCGHESVTRPNRLLCSSCGSFRVQVVAGDELSIASIEFAGATVPSRPDPAATPAPAARHGEDQAHV